MAVEKELLNMKFKNEEKYINGQSIAKLLQTMLNTAHGKAEFYVAYQRDTKMDPAAKYGGVLSCEIEPFSLRGTLAQTITIDYKCKVSSQLAADHADVNKTLESILGPVEGNFIVTEGSKNVEYYFWSNLRYGKPITNGDINEGVYPTTYAIKGTIHVVREGGALLSNTVKTYIKANDTKHEVALRRGSHGVSFTVSNPVKPGSFTAATEYISAGYAKSVFILYKDDYIGNILRDYTERRLEDERNPFLNKKNGKQEITIVEEYVDKTIETTYYILQATCERESGAYMSFALSLIQREEKVVLEGDCEIKIFYTVGSGVSNLSLSASIFVDDQWVPVDAFIAYGYMQFTVPKGKAAKVVVSFDKGMNMYSTQWHFSEMETQTDFINQNYTIG